MAIYREPLTKSQLYELYFKIIATTLTLGTVIMGLVQYREGQNLRIAAEQDAAREKVWEERLRIYNTASEVAAATAAAFRILVDESEGTQSALPSEVRLQNYLKARGEFFRLYWGNLCLLEDRNVEYAMVYFGKAVNDAEAVIGLEALKWGVNQQETAEADAGEAGAIGEAVQGGERNRMLREHADRLERLSAQLARVFRGSLMDTWNPHDTFKVLLGRDQEESKPSETEKSYGNQALIEMGERMDLRRYAPDSQTQPSSLSPLEQKGEPQK